MLEHSFVHVAGVGPGTERALWASGLTGWGALLASPAGPPQGSRLTASRWTGLRRAVDESAQRLGAGDAGYFQQRLPAAQAWRLFGDFCEQAAYLDIETDGSYQQNVTTVVVHRDGQTHFFVRDRNLYELPMHLAGVRLLVTYNGKCFDWPVLARQFAQLPQPAAHLDLRYPFARLGFRGGLKAIEKGLKLSRPGELEGIDGLAAVWLWHRHRQGEPHALDCLLRYNAEDVLNLKFLAQWVYNAMASPLPVPARLFEKPTAAICPDLPAADTDLMERCRRELQQMELDRW